MRAKTVQEVELQRIDQKSEESQLRLPQQPIKILSETSDKREIFALLSETTTSINLLL